MTYISRILLFVLLVFGSKALAMPEWQLGSVMNPGYDGRIPEGGLKGTVRPVDSIYVLPYAQDFDLVNPPQLPSGFTALLDSTGAVGTTSSTTVVSEPNCIYLVNYDQADGAVLLILPPFADSLQLGDLRIRFMARCNGTGQAIIVGGVPSLTDPASFVPNSTVPITQDWEEYAVALGSYLCDGPGRFIAFRYPNNSYYMAFLDNITVERRFEVDLAVTAVTGNETPAVGEMQSYVASLFNWGQSQQANYLVKLYSTTGIELASAVGVPINPGQAAEITLNWSPENVTPLEIYAKVILAADQNPLNDSSPIISIFPHPATVLSITVGSGNQNLRLPVVMNYRCSLFQTIYTAAELGYQQGAISSLVFYNSFTQNIMQSHTSIWLGTTVLDDLSTGWIPATQLYQVFDGPVDYPSGQNVISITLNQPFQYLDGQNLVMMVLRPLDTGYYSSNNTFKAQTSTNSRSRKVWSDNTIYNPFYPPENSTLSGQFPKTTFLISPLATGQINGVVQNTHNLPLTGVQVNIVNTPYSDTTDTLGNFNLGVLPVGDYTISFSKHGYNSADLTVQLTQSENEYVYVQLSAMQAVTVTGFVMGSDTGAIITNASITLNGYDDYQAYMPEQGAFSIPGVYANQNYSFHISATGYSTASGIIQIGTIDFNWGNIVLTELAFPPENVEAELWENMQSVLITWQQASALSDPALAIDKCVPNRNLQGYKLWRLAAEQLFYPESWFLLQPEPTVNQMFYDSGWSDLLPGNYQWAVQACYTANVVSSYVFSNVISKPQALGALVGFIYGKNNQALAGAAVSTQNYNAVSNSSGAYYLVLPAGSYEVTVNATGYYPYTCSSVNIFENQNTTLNYTLESLSNPEVPTPGLETALLGNNPNPFKDNTIISYNLKKPASVRLQIYNLKGQLLRLIDLPFQPGGLHNLSFDGRDRHGSALPAGIYFCRFSSGAFSQTKKMLLYP